MRERIDYIDRAKGILILLVIIGHVFQGGYVHDYIYIFHMPAFFIISGMLMNHSSVIDKPYTTIIKSRVYSIGVPFLFFELYGCLSYIIRFGFKQSVAGFIFNTVTCAFNNGVNWFLFALFWGELLFLATVKAVRKNRLALFVFAAAIFIINLFIPSANRIVLAFRQALLCFVLLVVGYLLESLLTQEKTIWGIVSAIVIILIPLFSESIDLASMELRNPLVFLVGAICGTYLMLLIGRLLPKKPFNYLGQNTIIIFGTHNLFYILIGHALGITDFHITPVLTGFVIFIGVIAIEIPIMCLMNRYLPFLIGKRKKSNVR